MSSRNSFRIGLVLSGGGAKGAYQVGVLKALTEMGVQVDAIAGASIGALNGAIIAAAPSQALAVDRLQTLWQELAANSPIKASTRAYGLAAQLPIYLLMLNSFGLSTRLLSTGVASLVTQLGEHHAKKLEVLTRNLAPLKSFLGEPQGLACDQRLRSLIDEYLPATGLPDRVGMYVSVYPTQGAARDIVHIVAADLGFGDTAPSEFFHIQSLPADTQKSALLASAALPLLFAPQEINGRAYTDGGQGGWNSTQGNTPIQPLLDAGYSNIVVTHLSDGSLWDRQRFPSANVIEIRPISRSISRSGGAGDLLGFNEASLPSWIDQGYEDTLRCVGRIKVSLDVHTALVESELARDQALAQTGEAPLQAAMRRLGPIEKGC